MRIDIDDGHYTIVFEEATGRLYALRYGQEWRDCTGDNLLLLTAMKVERLRSEVAKLREVTAGQLASEGQWMEMAQRLNDRIRELESDKARRDWQEEGPDRIGMWVYRQDGFGYAIVRCDELTDDVAELTWLNASPQGAWDGEWKLLEEDQCSPID